MEIEGVKMLLGSWWMEAAIRGQVDILPLININHQEEAVADAINAPVVAANGDTGANQWHKEDIGPTSSSVSSD